VVADWDMRARVFRSPLGMASIPEKS